MQEKEFGTLKINLVKMFQINGFSFIKTAQEDFYLFIINFKGSLSDLSIYSLEMVVKYIFINMFHIFRKRLIFEMEYTI